MHQERLPRPAGRRGWAVYRLVVDEAEDLPAPEVGALAPRIRPTVIGHREVAVAAGAFVDAVTHRHLNHRGQVELSRGVLGAKQRPLLGGQAFGWDRKAPGSSALIAASLALWGVDAEKPQRPRRKPPGEGCRIIVLR